MPMTVKNKPISFLTRLQHCEDIVVAFMHTRKGTIKEHNLNDFWKRIKKIEDAEKEGRHYDYSSFYYKNTYD